PNISGAKLQDDDKTVILQFDGTLTEDVVYDIEIDGIVSNAHDPIKKFEGTFSLEADETAPTLEDVFVQEDKLHLTFDERVDLGSNLGSNDTILRVDGTQLNNSVSVEEPTEPGDYTYVLSGGNIDIATTEGDHEL